MPNIIINTYCNQRCEYCFAEDSMYKDVELLGNMSLKTYLRILNYHAKYKLGEVRILWGEPLLHPLLPTFLKLAVKGGFSVTLFSNINFPLQKLERTFWGLHSTETWLIRINCNINNMDFYHQNQLENIRKNIAYLQSIGIDLTVGYNMYDLAKTPDDVLDFAKENGIASINLKITNTGWGKEKMIHTNDRSYGQYILRTLDKYHDDFAFFFSCGLSPHIFTEEEKRKIQTEYRIDLPYGCSGFSGKFDIDVRGEIFHCFPLKELYKNKNVHIDNHDPNTDLYALVGLEPSTDECVAHKNPTPIL